MTFDEMVLRVLVDADSQTKTENVPFSLSVRDLYTVGDILELQVKIIEKVGIVCI